MDVVFGQVAYYCERNMSHRFQGLSFNISTATQKVSTINELVGTSHASLILALMVIFYLDDED